MSALPLTASKRRRNRMAAGTVSPSRLVDRPIEEGEKEALAGPFIRRPASLDVAGVLPDKIDAELLLHRLIVGVFSPIPADEIPNFLLSTYQLLSSNALSASSIAFDA